MTLQKANLALSVLVCLLLGALVALVIVTGEFAEDEVSSAEAERRENLITVSTSRAEPTDSFRVTREYSGVTQAAREVDLGFSRAGRIVKIHAEAGDLVDAGDTLAELDTRRLELQKKAYEEALEAQEDSDRRGPPPQTTVSQTDLDLVELDLEDSRLEAPFDAVILSRRMTEGAMASPGHPVFQLIERDHIEALVSVPMDVAAEMVEGESHELRIGGKERPAEVDAVLPEVDMTTRTRTVTFGFDEQTSEELSPGEVVRMRFERTHQTEGFWLPSSALTREIRGLWSVYAVEKDEGGANRVRRRYVEVIHVEGDRARVRGTDNEPFDYIARGVHRVVPGQKVRIAGEEESEQVETSDEGETTEGGEDTEEAGAGDSVEEGEKNEGVEEGEAAGADGNDSEDSA